MNGEGDGGREPGGGEASQDRASPPQPDRFLVYGDDGARLVYSGGSADGYRAARRSLDASHAGALTGQSMMGRERWLIVTYYRHRPDDAFVRRRRESGLLGLAWEPAPAEPE